MEVEEDDDLPEKIEKLLYPGPARGTEWVGEGEGGEETDIPNGEIGPDTNLGTWYLVPFLRMR